MVSEPDPPGSPPAHDWPLVDFLLQLRQDQAADTVRPLREYLARYPDRELDVAREYLLVHALDDGAAAAGGRAFGPYQLERELGSGGEGTVFLAHDPLLRRRVALKVLTRHASELDEARVLRAAAVAARLDHPALCRVHGAGREGRSLWVAMQFVDGRTLAAELEQRRRDRAPLRPREIGALLAPLARGLQHAHAHGVVHRDVKPGNVLLCEDGRAMLTDFGLARDGEARHDLTGPGELRGTPAYMAPEQLRSALPLPSMDLWSLGVVAYECATLQQPFAAATPAATIERVLGCDVWSLPAWRALGADLRAVIAAALAKQPRQRYADAGAFAADLERLAAGEAVHVRAPGRLRRLRTWAQHERALAASIAAAALAVVGALAVSLSSLQREREMREVAQERADHVEAVASSIVFDMNDTLADAGGSVGMRQRLLRRALDALLQLADDEPQDLRRQRELCLAWMRLGDVSGHDAEPNLGDLEAAAQCFAEAEAIARRSLGDDPRRAAILATILTKRGDLAADDPERAIDLYRNAIAVATGDDDEQYEARGVAKGRLAIRARDDGELRAAATWIEAAEREFAACADTPRAAHNRFVTTTTRATILAAGGDPAAGERLLRAALAAASDAAAGPGALRARAQFDRTLANCVLMQGRRDEALTLFDAAVQRCRDLRAGDPTDRGASARLRDMLEARAAALDAVQRREAAARDRAEASALRP